MNLAESLLHGLRDHGAREIFGIPGDFALPLFKVIEESRILPLYLLSHEPAVGFAADAAARAHGGLSVAAVTYGAGAFNLLNAVCCAYAEKAPVVVLSGGPGTVDRSIGLMVHHQAKTLRSQFDVFREVTCDQVILDDVGHAPALVARALRSALTHSRPVYIEVPRDRVFEAAGPVPRLGPETPVDPDALAACVDEILARLAAGRRPVLMIDVEVRRFGVEAAVARLARKLGIPVVTTFLGRGLLADADVDLRGTYSGAAAEPDVAALVEDADALLALGVIRTDLNFALAVSEKRIDFRRAIVAADGQVTLDHHIYPSIPLAALVAALEARAGADRPARPTPPRTPTGLVADDAPITPTDIACAVNDLFARHGPMPLAADIGDCLFTTLDIACVDMVGPAYYGTMGYAVPAGLGLQVATGRRPLILVGDGAFQMTGWELLNCPRHGWDPVVLVFNNASWDMLRMFQPESRFNDLPPLDFAAIAATLGGEGRRVATRAALAAALEQAMARRGRFQLIDIAIARGAVSGALSRSVESVKRFRRRTSGH